MVVITLLSFKLILYYSRNYYHGDKVADIFVSLKDINYLILSFCEKFCRFTF